MSNLAIEDRGERVHYLQNGPFLSACNTQVASIKLVAWPLNGNMAGGDFALIQTYLLLSCKCIWLAIEQLDLHDKGSEGCIKTMSPPSSLPFKGPVTEKTIV